MSGGPVFRGKRVVVLARDVRVVHGPDVLHLGSGHIGLVELLGVLE